MEIPQLPDESEMQRTAHPLVCRLTTPELQARKEVEIANLWRRMVERRELDDGYAFRFPGTDEMLDELLAFIKTERECCPFFIFRLSVGGDGAEVWLELTGAEGVKDFVVTELGLAGGH